MSYIPIANNLAQLKAQIRNAEKQYHRPSHAVSVLAVSKTHPVETILEAIAAGQFAFGENYLQEALPKIAALSDKACEWHFIGPIQSNKTKKIAEHFHWVHSVDNIHHAKRLNDQRPSHLPPLNICIQVNISQEHTKAGVYPETVFQLAEACLLLPNIALRGLMTLPEPKKQFEQQRKPFQALRNLYEKLLEKGYMLDTLSMGMSNDWEAAIAEGSTLLRIGTALFGVRD